MKKILLSLMTLVVVAGMIGGGAFAYFSDTETSTGNTFSAGTIDIAVSDDGGTIFENPWMGDGFFTFEYVKPCETREATVFIKNVGNNDVKVWKKIYDIVNTGGADTYGGFCSSEPEYVEGNGQFDTNGLPDGSGYVERCNLSAYIVYDLYVNSVAIYPESEYHRIGEIADNWIELGVLAPGATMEVKQSYHLMAWPGASESEITNWAQGDTMTFNVEFYAEQTTGGATGPLGGVPSPQTLVLDNKDPVTWDPIPADGISGTLTYNTSGPTFNFSFTGVAPVASAPYELIYYAGDPWPGAGSISLGTGSSDGSGNINIPSTSVDLNQDLVAAKIWLVLDADFGTGQMTGWNPASYLFEANTISYDDTDV